MSASRKLYVELATTIQRHVRVANPNTEVPVIRDLVNDLCGDFKQDNMAFDKAKFLTACGLS